MTNFFAGQATIEIDLGYSNDVILDVGGVAVTIREVARSETGVKYIDYELENIDLGSVDISVDPEYQRWRAVGVGDYVVIDPELAFVPSEAGGYVVAMIEGGRYYVAYDFDEDIANSRAVSSLARRLKIIRIDAGKTYLRDYHPDFNNAIPDGSCRVLNDTYFVIPSEIQKAEASITIQKESQPLKSLLSSQAIKYTTLGIGCELTLTLASVEMENLGKLFDLPIAEQSVSEGNFRKRVSMTDGEINSTNLPTRLIRLLPEEIVEPIEDQTDVSRPVLNQTQFLNWLKGVVTFPRGVLKDSNQDINYSPNTQQEFKAKINCTPDEKGNRLYFGNTYFS